MSFKLKKWILAISPFGLLALLLILYWIFENKAIIEGVFWIGLAAEVVLSIMWWRCPICGRPLRSLSIFAKYCPYCGEELE